MVSGVAVSCGVGRERHVRVQRLRCTRWARTTVHGDPIGVRARWSVPCAPGPRRRVRLACGAVAVCAASLAARLGAQSTVYRQARVRGCIALGPWLRCAILRYTDPAVILTLNLTPNTTTRASTCWLVGPVSVTRSRCKLSATVLYSVHTTQVGAFHFQKDFQLNGFQIPQTLNLNKELTHRNLKSSLRHSSHTHTQL
jgi:hypothetical protein